MHLLYRTLVAPTKFTGATQSVTKNEDWWSYFQRCAKCKKLLEANQLELIGLLMSGGADEWFQALTAHDKESMANFEKVFQANLFIV